MYAFKLMKFIYPCFKTNVQMSKLLRSFLLFRLLSGICPPNACVSSTPNRLVFAGREIQPMCLFDRPYYCTQGSH